MSTSSPRFPEVQRSNLTNQLSWLLQRKLDEEELSFDRAYSHIALDILGYDLGLGTMSDGRGDFGIDYWVVDERTATVFQFKSHDFTEALDSNFTADSKYLSDLPRIDNLLTHLNEVPAEANVKVQDFVKELRSAVHRYSLTLFMRGRRAHGKLFRVTRICGVRFEERKYRTSKYPASM